MFIVGFGASVIAKPEKSCRAIQELHHIEVHYIEVPLYLYVGTKNRALGRGCFFFFC